MSEKRMIYNFQPDVPPESLSTTMTLVGPVNCSAFDRKDALPSCLSTTYTVGSVIEAADNQPQGGPSGPLRGGAVRAINSVISTRVRESAILRATDGDF
jgi:hypothetical protein